jgi:hypothetical protein
MVVHGKMDPFPTKVLTFWGGQVGHQNASCIFESLMVNAEG